MPLPLAVVASAVVAPVGTAVEWVFLSQGRRMLTAKGIDGGKDAMPSSFAMSAAAFGQVKATACAWEGPTEKLLRALNTSPSTLRSRLVRTSNTRTFN